MKKSQLKECIDALDQQLDEVCSRLAAIEHRLEDTMSYGDDLVRDKLDQLDVVEERLDKLEAGLAITETGMTEEEPSRTS